MEPKVLGLTVSHDLIRQVRMFDKPESDRLATLMQPLSESVNSEIFVYTFTSEFLPFCRYPRNLWLLGLFSKGGASHLERLKIKKQNGFCIAFFVDESDKLEVTTVRAFTKLKKISIAGKKLSSPGFSYSVIGDDGKELKSITKEDSNVSDDMVLFEGLDDFSGMKYLYVEVTGRSTNNNNKLFAHLVIPVKVDQEEVVMKKPKPVFKTFVDTSVYSVDHVVVKSTFIGNVETAISVWINGRPALSTLVDVQKLNKVDPAKDVPEEYSYQLVSTAAMPPLEKDGAPPTNVLVTLKNDTGNIIHSEITALK